MLIIHTYKRVCILLWERHVYFSSKGTDQKSVASSCLMACAIWHSHGSIVSTEEGRQTWGKVGGEASSPL